MLRNDDERIEGLRWRGVERLDSLEYVAASRPKSSLVDM